MSMFRLHCQESVLLNVGHWESQMGRTLFCAAPAFGLTIGIWLASGRTDVGLEGPLARLSRQLLSSYVHCPTPDPQGELTALQDASRSSIPSISLSLSVIFHSQTLITPPPLLEGEMGKMTDQFPKAGIHIGAMVLLWPLAPIGISQPATPSNAPGICPTNRRGGQEWLAMNNAFNWLFINIRRLSVSFPISLFFNLST